MAVKVNLKITRQDKRLFVAGAALLMVAVVFLLSLPALVDKAAIQSDIRDLFKQATGLDIEIQDGVEVTLLPTPHVTARNLYVANVPGASSSFLLSVRSVDIKLRPTSLLSSHPVASAVVIDGVNVELERLRNGRMNWREAAHLSADGIESTTAVRAENKDLLSGFSHVIPALAKVGAVSVVNAELHYSDNVIGVTTDYTDIGMKYAGSDKKSILNLSLNYGDFPLSMKVELGDLGEAYNQKSSTGRFSIESAQSHLDFEGDVGFADSPILKGKAVFESKNMARWVHVLNGAGIDGAVTDGLKELPLKLESAVATDGAKIQFPNIAVSGGVFSGTLQATLKLPLTWDVKGTLDKVDMDTLISSGVFAPEKKDDNGDIASAGATAVGTSKKSLWSYVTLGVDVKADEVNFNQNHIKSGHLSFDMSDGEMTISEVSGTFPGDSRLLFTGIGKEGYQGFMVDGQLDGSGDDFVDMASTFKTGGGSAPLPTELKRYRFKTNMVLSSKELRFTEVSARVESTAVVGGLIATFGNKVKIQSAMRIGGLDADKLLAIWGVNKFRENLATEVLAGEKVEDDASSWLKSINYEVDLRASLEQYTLGGKQRDKCKFRVTASQNKLTLSEIEMGLEETQLVGRVALDVTEALPFFDVDLTADTVDASAALGGGDFLLDTTAPSKAGERNWSHKGFDFHWFDHLNANFHLRLGVVKVNALEANAIDVKGVLKDRTLNLTTFYGIVDGAQMAGKGFIKGGKIPSASFTGDAQGVNVAEVAHVVPALQGMFGKYNAHYRFSTSGIDVYTWLYNAEGNVSLSGHDVTVDGFNLPAIIGAVGYVRTVADILDAVKRAFPGGSTVFSSIEGEWTIGNGVLKTPKFKLLNEMAEGEFAGSVDLINWKMNGHIAFALTYLDKATPPKMTINYVGPIDAVDKELDTRLLEQYVANKTSERLLQSPSTP